jgi:hypothetical protein
MNPDELRSIIEEAVGRYVEKTRPAPPEPAEMALRSELTLERRKREQLERRVNELVEEGQKAHEAAERAERHAAIKSELQQLGVAKVDLAFRALRDEVQRGEDGRLYAYGDEGPVPLRDYLSRWVASNPEFKPARIAGGAGAAPSRGGLGGASIAIEDIRPGMKADDLERARQEVARIAQQSMGGHVF